MRDAIDGMTGLTIQYSALIDMYGFSNLVDTLRGVTMNVPVAVPIHADEGFTTAAEWIQPGIQLMDGYYAPRYARSRHDPTDYDRTQLQQAIVCWWP